VSLVPQLNQESNFSRAIDGLPTFGLGHGFWIL